MTYIHLRYVGEVEDVVFPLDPGSGGGDVVRDGVAEEGDGEVDAASLKGSQDVFLGGVDPDVSDAVLQHEIHHLRRDQPLGALPSPVHANIRVCAAACQHSHHDEGDRDRRRRGGGGHIWKLGFEP